MALGMNATEELEICRLIGIRQCGEIVILDGAPVAKAREIEAILEAHFDSFRIEVVQGNKTPRPVQSSWKPYVWETTGWAAAASQVIDLRLARKDDPDCNGVSYPPAESPLYK